MKPHVPEVGKSRVLTDQIIYVSAFITFMCAGNTSLELFFVYQFTVLTQESPYGPFEAVTLGFWEVWATYFSYKLQSQKAVDGLRK